MPGVVADTHTIVWYLSKDPRLSLAAHKAPTTATTGGDLIHIRSICLVSSIDQTRPKNPRVAGANDLVATSRF